jgi:hypothetical protein
VLCAAHVPCVHWGQKNVHGIRVFVTLFAENLCISLSPVLVCLRGKCTEGSFVFVFLLKVCLPMKDGSQTHPVLYKF